MSACSSSGAHVPSEPLDDPDEAFARIRDDERVANRPRRKLQPRHRIDEQRELLPATREPVVSSLRAAC